MRYLELKRAREELNNFNKISRNPQHARFLFPFLLGTYFTYRKIDIARITKIAYSISPNPSFLDVGCGYGDFLTKIREYIPDAEGLEKDHSIFFNFKMQKPNYIKIGDARSLDASYDIIFVGWMEPGIDFRFQIAKRTETIITTLDQGLSLAAEYDDMGFDLIAKWTTPSWEDMSTEITNKYYSNIEHQRYVFLKTLRGMHNIWHIYIKRTSNRKETVRQLLKSSAHGQGDEYLQRYDFEETIDECGYKIDEKIYNPNVCRDLFPWKMEIV